MAGTVAVVSFTRRRRWSEMAEDDGERPSRLRRSVSDMVVNVNLS
jgi:hypothetical protein